MNAFHCLLNNTQSENEKEALDEGSAVCAEIWGVFLKNVYIEKNGLLGYSMHTKPEERIGKQSAHGYSCAIRFHQPVMPRCIPGSVVIYFHGVPALSVSALVDFYLR